MSTGIVVAVLAMVTAACGSVEPAGGPSTSTTAALETTTEQTTSTEQTTTTPPTDTTVTTVARPEISVAIAGGEVEGPDVVEVGLGDTVEVWVVSDVDDEIHVHGYDLTFEISADVPLRLVFVADVPGVFEVETHTGHTHLFDIRVIG